MSNAEKPRTLKIKYDAVVKERDELKAIGSPAYYHAEWKKAKQALTAYEDHHIECHKTWVKERDALVADRDVWQQQAATSAQAITKLGAQLAEYRGVDKTDHRYQPCVNRIERLERALAYAKKCLTPEQKQFGCLTELERLERGE
jgi:hypothetical protein